MAQMKPSSSRAIAMLLALAPTEEPAVAAMQAVLRFPGDGFHGLVEPIVAPAQRVAQPRRMPIAPGRLHDHAAQVGVAGLGNAATAYPRAARVFARDRAAIAHKLT